LRAPPTGFEDEATTVVKRQPGDDPVFLDRTGYRRRLTAVAGVIGGLVLTVILLALVAGFTGAGPAAVPGWPDAAAGAARKVRPEQSPSGRPSPTQSPPNTDETAQPGQITAGRPTRAPTTPTSPAVGSTPAPSPSATPTPKNNGRRPSHAPNPRSSRKG
jgi:hypothetical protein